MKHTLAAICVLQVASAQSTEDAKSILQLSEPEQRQFVKSFLDASFPEKDGDKFSLLLVNRSGLVVPMLESRVQQELKQPHWPARLTELASVMIAYAGEEESLRAVSDLIAVDENKFGDLVGRTLDNAGNWRNPFAVAYRGMELGDDKVSRRIAAWVEGGLVSARIQKAWAEAMLDRYGRVPVKSDWVNDPIASRLKDGLSEELRRSITLLAADEQRKRVN